MKFVPESLAGANMISRFDSAGPARVWVGAAAHERSLFVPWIGAVMPWDVAAWPQLSLADFERMAAFEPELVIFGTGARMRFAPPSLLRPLIERRIGIECMDTAAACRTYNVLVSERRSVLGALLIGVD
jgi:uncharacterized protein